MRIDGTFESPEVDELRQKSLSALALGVVLPVIGAIIPFVEEGEAESTNCARLVRAASAAVQDQPAVEPSD